MNENIANQNVAQRFVSLVGEHFAYLEQMAFIRSVTSPHSDVRIVRYQSAAIYIELRLVPPAYEPELVFGELGIDDQIGAFDLEIGDLLNSGRVLPEPIPYDGDGLARGIAWLAQVFQRIGTDVIKGQLQSLPQMRANRRTSVLSWHEQERLAEKQVAADHAWKAKDYVRYLAITEKFDSGKNTILMKRRIFARKAIGAPTE